MALETHSVELELLTQDFVKNIREAQKNLEEIAKTASRTGAEVGENLGEGIGSAEGPISQTVSGLGTLLGVLKKVLLVVVGAGGFILAFEGLRRLLTGLLGDNAALVASFTKFSRALSITVGTTAGLIRGFTGAKGALGSFLTRIQSTTINITPLISGLQGIIATSPAFRTFAVATLNSMNLVRRGAVNLVRKGFNLLLPAGALVANVGRTVGRGLARIPIVGRATLRFLEILELQFARIGASTAALIPGLSRFAIGLERGAIAATAAAGVIGGTGAAVSTLQISAGLAIGTIAAFNGILLILGVTLAAVGKKLLRFAEGLALQAAQANIAFIQLEASFEAANKAAEGTLGTLDDFNKFVEETSKVTGAAVADVANVASQFLLLNPQLKLSQESLEEVIKDTLALAITSGDLARSLLDVKDAFLKQPGPLRRFVGIETAATEVEERLAKDIEFRQKATERATDATEKAIKASAIQIIINEGLAARTSILTGESVSLVVEQQRLQASIANVAREFGESMEPTLIRITKFFKALIETLSLVPGPLKAITGVIITTTGVILTVIGTIIKFGTVIVLLTSVNRILNAVLAIGNKRFGTIGLAIQSLSARVLGLNINLTTATGKIAALGTIAGVAFQRLGRGISFVIGSLTGLIGKFFLLNISLTGIATGLKVVGVAVVGLAARLIPLAVTFAIVSAKALLIGAAIAAFVVAVRELNEEFDLFNRFVQPIINAVTELVELFGGLDVVIGFLTTAFRLLVIVIKNILLTLILGITVIIVALGEAAKLAARGIDFLAEKAKGLSGTILRLLPGMGFFLGLASKLSKGTGDLAGKVDEKLNPSLDALQNFMVDVTRALEKGGEQLRNLFDDSEKAAEGIDKAKEAIKELAVSAEVLESVFEITLKAVNNSIKGTIESFAEQNKALDRAAEVEKRFIRSSIDGETRREIEIDRINRRLVEQKIASAQEVFTRESALIQKRLDLELKAFKELESKEKLTTEGRIKKNAEFVQKAIEAQKELTARTKQELEKQLSDLGGILNRRAILIQSIENRIRNIQNETEQRIFDIRLKNFNAEEQNSRLRRRAETQLSQAKRALAQGDFELAEQLAKSADSTFQRISQAQGQSEKVFGEQQIRDLNKVQRARLEIANQQKAELKAAQELDLQLRRQLIVGIEELAVKFEQLAEQLSKPLEVIIKFISDEEAVQRAIKQLKEKGIDIGTTIGEPDTAPLDDVKIIKDELGQPVIVNVGVDEIGFQQFRELRDNRDKIAQDVDTKITLQGSEDFLANAGQILKTQGELKQTIFTNVITNVDEVAIAKVQATRAELAQPINVDVIYTAKGDVPNRSIVPIEELAPAVTELLQKGVRAITTPFRAAVDAIAGPGMALAGALPGVPGIPGGGGPSQTIRVDINMEGEQFPVDVADQGSANNLVAFTKTLKTLGRTRGNFRSPTSRGS